MHPLAIKALAEVGVNIAGQQSKSVEVFRNVDFDQVITVCDNAAKNCPVWLGKGRHVHLGFPDPAAIEGGSATKLHIFRQVRNAIQARVLEYLAQIDEMDEENRCVFAGGVPPAKTLHFDLLSAKDEE